MKEMERDFLTKGKRKRPNTPDKYLYWKIISTLVRLGFGNYYQSKNAEIVEAMRFIYLSTQDRPKDKTERFLSG